MTKRVEATPRHTPCQLSENQPHIAGRETETGDVKEWRGFYDFPARRSSSLNDGWIDSDGAISARDKKA
jgi:hypothetical protein